MKSQRGMRYDNSIDAYPIKEGEIWQLADGSSIMVNDIKNGVPDIMKCADCIFIDPAGGTALLKGYYTKADKDCPFRDFEDFCTYISNGLKIIQPKWVFVEAFKPNKKALKEMLSRIFPYVREIPSTYYHTAKYPCVIFQAGYEDHDFGLDGLDEEDIVYELPKRVPMDAIADFFLGRGLTAVAAFAANKQFFGSDMNANRLAVGIRKIAEKGGNWSIKTL